MQYERYQINDFVCDAFFRKWVLAPDEECNAFWHQWLQNHPARQVDIQQARLLVMATDVAPIPVSCEKMQDSREQVKKTLFSPQQSTSIHPLPQRRNKQTILLKAAAVISGFILLSIYFTQNVLPQTREYTTAYGEILEVSLPDGSLVTLNANSQIKVAEDWQHSREVWLTGEAYFDVAKISAAQAPAPSPDRYRKFTVHAGDIDVEVMGTRFNVTQRYCNTKVILEEGLVSLRENERNNTGIRMNAGEAVVFSKNERIFKKEIVDTRVALSWKKGMHVFNGTPLKAIARTLEDTYGFEVKFGSDELKEKRFSAQIPYGETDLLLTLISESLEVEVLRNDKLLYIE